MSTAGAAVLLALVIVTGVHPRKLVQDATAKIVAVDIKKETVGERRDRR